MNTFNIKAILLLCLFCFYVSSAQEEGEVPPSEGERPVEPSGEEHAPPEEVNGELPDELPAEDEGEPYEPPPANWKCNKEERASQSVDSVQVSDFDSYSEDGEEEGKKEDVICVYEPFEMSEGKHYFQLQVEKSNFESYIGLAKKTIIDDGQPAKGLFYNDNLFDGQEIKRSGFGDQIDSSNREHDIISFLVDFTGDDLQVSIRHEDYGLGVAYKIAKPDAALVATVIFKGNGMVTLVKKDADEAPSFDRVTKNEEGTFEIEDMKQEVEEGMDPEEPVTCNAKELVVSANRAMFTGENAKDAYDISYCDGKNRGILRKILAEGAPQETWDFDLRTSDCEEADQQCTQFIKQMLYNLENFSTEEENSKIKFVSKSKKTLTADRKSDVDTTSPVTESPFV